MNIPVLNPPKDRDLVVANANAFLEREHGSRQRQWAYGHVPRQLIVEEALFQNTPLIEVKYYTFGTTVEQFVIRREGPPLVASRWQRQGDGSFKRSETSTYVSDVIDEEPLPDIVLSRGLELASEIGGHFDHMRVDTMTDGVDLFLGELTVYSIAGRTYDQGHYVDAPLNRSWDLRKSWFLTTPQQGWRAAYAAALRRALDRRAAVV